MFPREVTRKKRKDRLACWLFFEGNQGGGCRKEEGLRRERGVEKENPVVLRVNREQWFQE